MPTDLDRGGNLFTRVRVNRGPTLGWKEIQVEPPIDITDPGPFQLGNNASRVLVNAAAPVTILLPDVEQWLKQSFEISRPAFDQSIWIKDMSFAAGTNNIIVQGHGAQLVDGQLTYVIMQDGQLLRCWPLYDFSGWYLG